MEQLQSDESTVLPDKASSHSGKKVVRELKKKL